MSQLCIRFRLALQITGTDCFTRRLGFVVQYWGMNVADAAKKLNEKAVRENWHHICDPTLAFSDDTYEELLGLWRAKAMLRPMPRRSDMTPRDLKNILRNIVMFERVRGNPSRYRWRLIGTGVTEIAGSHTGKMIDETVPAEHLPRWIDCFDMILDGGQPLRFLGQVHLEGREYLDAENLYVPLADDNDVPTFAMAYCRYTPRNFDAEDSWEKQLAGLPSGLL